MCPNSTLKVEKLSPPNAPYSFKNERNGGVTVKLLKKWKMGHSEVLMKLVKHTKSYASYTN